ncbi:MAG: mucoidy inhibitor MuiA family protein, partial [Planctomycetota bacterium]|nr:mucoidy inhibitor MuiA family protein [Planctomycetota bacterium]
MKISMILCLASLLLDINPVIAQQQIVRIDSKIDRVTVYPGFALVERIALIPEQEVGSEFTLAIGPLPSSAQPSSFQTQVVGDAIAVQGLELKSRLSAVVSNKDEEGLLKDKDDLMLQLLDLKAKKAGIELQIVSLNKMSSMVFAESGVSSTTFENASEHLKFLRSQRTIYESNMQHCERDMAKVVAKVDDIDTQLNGVRSKAKSKVREARLSCFAQRKAPSQVRLTYLVAGASWHPAYDVHVSTDMTGVSVNAIGQVSQRTGEDWSGVNLVLSTSMPQIGLDPPQVPSLSVSAIDMSRQQGDSSWASDDVIGANAELKFGGRSKRGRP